MFQKLTAAMAALCLATPALAQSLEASVLPSARAVENNATATIFMTVLNSGSADATNCSVQDVARGSTLSDLNWTVVENGTPVGNQNAPFSIPADGRIDLVVASTDSNNTYNTGFQAVCDGGVASPIRAGVNTALIAFDSSPADIIPIIATTSGDGVIRFNAGNGVAAFAIAAVNIGTERDVRITGRRIGLLETPGIRTRICETDAGGVCLAPRTGFLDVTLGSTPRLFSFRVEVLDGGVPFLPDILRYEVQLEDQTDFNRFTTTAALYRPGELSATGDGNEIGTTFEIVARNRSDSSGAEISTGLLMLGTEPPSGVVVQEVQDGFVRRTFPETFQILDPVYERRSPSPETDCGTAGDALPEGCILRLTGTSRIYDGETASTTDQPAICTFDRDGRARCTFSAAAASAELDRGAVIIGSDFTLAGAAFENVDPLGYFESGGVGLGFNAVSNSPSGGGVPGSYTTGVWSVPDDFSPSGFATHALTSTFSFELDGCTMSGTITVFRKPYGDGTFILAASGQITSVNCGDEVPETAFWRQDSTFRFSGPIRLDRSASLNGNLNIYGDANGELSTHIGLSTE